jgi:hypothetical protein
MGGTCSENGRVTRNAFKLSVGDDGTTHVHDDDDNDDDRADGARLCMWTVVTNGPIVNPPRWYMSMENNGRIITTGKQSWIVHQAPWQSYKQSSSSKQEELAKETMLLVFRSVLFHTSKGSLTWRKILRQGGRLLYFPSVERCAVDLYCPRSGLNPQTWGPMASPLTTRPPRTTYT